METKTGNTLFSRGTHIFWVMGDENRVIGDENRVIGDGNWKSKQPLSILEWIAKFKSLELLNFPTNSFNLSNQWQKVNQLPRGISRWTFYNLGVSKE